MLAIIRNIKIWFKSRRSRIDPERNPDRENSSTFSHDIATTQYMYVRENKLSPTGRRCSEKFWFAEKSKRYKRNWKKERRNGGKRYQDGSATNARAGEPLSASRGTWSPVQVENDTGYKRRIRKFRGAMKNATAELSSTWIFHRCELSPGRESYSRDSRPLSRPLF